MSDDFDKFNTTFRITAVIGGLVSLAIAGGVIGGAIYIVTRFVH